VTAHGRKTVQFERFLVIDPSLAAAKMLANLLRSLSPSAQVYGAQDAGKAMLLAAEVDPEMVFVEAAAPGFDGMAFTRSFRRSDLACREAPIVMVFSEVVGAQILGARDSGVHEFLRRPVSLGDLERRLDAVSGRPRDWIEGVNYVGPDRRRFNSAADYQGPNKRRTDGTKTGQKINQALRIIQSASRQVEADPVQAARALSTQARILIELSAGQAPLRRLAAAATTLQAYLHAAARQGAPLASAQVETYAANVMLAAPDKVRPQAA
jgi:DNA-binding response OmpR family regulator